MRECCDREVKVNDEFKIKSHKNEVLDMKGNVLESKATIEIEKVRDPKAQRPDAIGTHLLQARHMYNQMEDITDQVQELGVNLGKSAIQDTKYRVFKIHYYGYGLWWATLLRILAKRPDLKQWSPDLFANDEECSFCKGKGRISYEPGSDEYNKAFNDFSEMRFGDDKPLTYGTEIGLYCSPCQGVGFIYRKQK